MKAFSKTGKVIHHYWSCNKLFRAVCAKCPGCKEGPRYHNKDASTVVAKAATPLISGRTGGKN